MNKKDLVSEKVRIRLRSLVIVSALSILKKSKKLLKEIHLQNKFWNPKLSHLLFMDFGRRMNVIWKSKIQKLVVAMILEEKYRKGQRNTNLYNYLNSVPRKHKNWCKKKAKAQQINGYLHLAVSPAPSIDDRLPRFNLALLNYRRQHLICLRWNY